MTKISADHLARGAYVYIRQSTSYQVANNTESGRRQYGLVERAHQLGFPEVHVIDDDLGRSGGGVARPGFEKLLAAICARRVGAVLSIEASRLARNGRDWHTLLEFCALVETVIIDEDGIYDPRMPNDRLLLGMKGTMSEMETSMFRQRSMEAMKQKARRGELFMTVAVGYDKTDDDRIEKTPDQGVRDAINLIFSKFAELQTIRQVLLWMRQDKILFPAIVQRAGQRPLEWKLPIYTTLHHILTNPVYAGAYAFGRRRRHVTLEAGRKRVIRTLRRNWNEWDVLIKDHHDGYIGWEEFERNQRLIADNANGKSFLGRGSVRRGYGLLPGLLRCARCGRRLHVSYGGGSSQRSLRYFCRGAFGDRAQTNCISFGGNRVDRAIAQEVIERVQPIGVEAALAAMKSFAQEQSEKQRQLENALEQARFEASRAHRQYDAVDPENRLVASNLERRWNDRLLAVRALEDQLAQLETASAKPLREIDRERLFALGRDLSQAWDSPGVTVETRKKIVRLLISEIVIDVIGDMIRLIIHWQGGDHTCMDIKKNKVGQTNWATDTSVIEIVQTLARQMPDASIAMVLNRAGKSTGRGNGWSRSRVYSLRYQHGIAPYVAGERQERGEATFREAAKILAVSPATILRMISAGLLPAKQVCKAAPWVLRLADLQRDDIIREADRRRSRRPVSHASHQAVLDL
jgi:DNA invertase Pin-like site-specific DNA recombinase